MTIETINFDNITYLQNGNTKQKQAYVTLTDNQVLFKIQKFDPILVGTIPISIDIEKSDLDIICYFKSKKDFKKSILLHFSTQKNFTIREQMISGNLAIVANFTINQFEIEIFGQNIPVKQQLGYRHMIIEYQLLRQFGESFRQQIIELKEQGHKTEAAFGIVLGLTTDPYIESLKFETIDKIMNVNL